MNKNEEIKHLKLKSARVPLRICLKLALKNMWKKKFRYLVMFIICAISLTFLSFTIELNGNIITQNVNTMVENGYRLTDIYEHVEMSEEQIKENEYNKYAHQIITGSKYDDIKQKISNITVHEYASVSINYAGIAMENANYFYTGIINTIIKFDKSNNYELICGRLPDENKKEVLITDYLVQAFEYFDLYPTATSIYDYLNKQINLVHENNYTIVGIIKTNYDTWTKFSNIESVDVSDKTNYSYEYDFIFFNSVILGKSYFDLEKLKTSDILAFNNRTTAGTSTGKWRVETVDKSLIGSSDGYYEEPLALGLTNTNVKLATYTSYDYYTGNTYRMNFGKAPSNDDEIVIPYTWIQYLFDLDWKTTTDWSSNRTNQRTFNQIKDKEITLTLTSKENSENVYKKNYKIVGITDETRYVAGSNNSRICQISTTEFTNIYQQFNVIEQKILVELPKNANDAETLFNNAYRAGYVIDVFAYQSDIEGYNVDPFINLMSKAGLFIFAAFTMGLIWTIISIEIVDSKKEIGILRSIGLSGGKVALIFIIQTASTIFLSYFLGVYLAYRLIPIFNSGIMDEYNKIVLYMYTFTYRTPLYLALFVILMTIISTIIPLIKILSNKIIDVINERDN